jgi:hypothetical protein
MTKILSTLQDLWSYCLFCPICQKASRKAYISVGPDEAFELVSFEKENQFLTINCNLKIKRWNHNAKYIINCLDNTFLFFISDSSSQEPPVEKASTPYFFFCIQSRCEDCDDSLVHSNDIELNLLTKTLVNVGLEQEEIYLLNQKNKYHITLSYYNGNMIISKCFEEDGKIIDDNKPMNFPIVDFDFSNPSKVINKIKTILVFS